MTKTEERPGRRRAAWLSHVARIRTPEFPPRGLEPPLQAIHAVGLHNTYDRLRSIFRCFSMILYILFISRFLEVLDAVKAVVASSDQ